MLLLVVVLVVVLGALLAARAGLKRLGEIPPFVPLSPGAPASAHDAAFEARAEAWGSFARRCAEPDAFVAWARSQPDVREAAVTASGYRLEVVDGERARVTSCWGLEDARPTLVDRLKQLGRR